MSDRETLERIAAALRLPEPAAAVRALVELRRRLEEAGATTGDAMAQTLDALVEAAGRAPDLRAAHLAHLQDRAEWLAATRGPSDPRALRAWSELADLADEECAWGPATRAWQAIADALLGDRAAAPGAHPDELALLLAALRGLAARRLAAGELATARQLLDRALGVAEQLYPAPHAQLALSLGDLAAVVERMGDPATAARLVERQGRALEASGAPAAVVERARSEQQRLHGLAGLATPAAP
jgi:hypothetical protein